MYPPTRLTSVLGTYPRMLWVLAFCSVCDMCSSAFIWPFVTVYVHEHLGQSLTMAGVVMLLHCAGAILGQLIGGWLYDLVGARPVMLFGLSVAAVSTGALGFTHSWSVYVACMVLYGISAAMAVPPVNAMLARCWPGHARRAFNFNYVVSNLGFALGSAVAGALADRSFSFAYLGAGAIFIVCALFTAAFIREEHAGPAENPGTAGSRPGAPPEEPVPWFPMVALFVAAVGVVLVFNQWQVGNSVRMEALGYPISWYSALWTLNGLVIFAGQPVARAIARRVRGATGQMAVGILLYAAAFGVLFTSTRYGIFVCSMILLTLGEILLMPTLPAVVARLAPPSRSGTFQGFILTGSTIGRMFGPLLGGMLHDAAGYRVQMGVMTSVLVVPLLAVLACARYLRDRSVEV
ncbi:MAG: MFS transporter [Symbiobacterium sp.]|uniref:MDR family MFS transporter n=1 Tax=Symbiobacterium sp. TaxID=1971213 RepID=UPI003464D714